MTDWVRHAMWWHVYPLGFLGAEPAALPDGAPPEPRLRRLVDWLDYLLDLGLNGLALGPVFAAETHGYDTVDHFRVDPRLGTEEDLLALIDACRARGVRVTLDGVFNHVGRGFPRFAEVLRDGPDAASAGWFRLSWPSGAGPGDEPGYESFEGHEALVALDHANPAVVAHVADVMTYWLDRGIDGWRLDAAYAVPASFWAEVLPRVRAKHPDAYIFGEVIHGDYAAFVTGSGVDAVTQYELWKAIWSSLNDVNLHELAWSLTRHAEFLETFVPLTFVGNHDVTRIASRLEDPRRLTHALVVLLTVGGTPTVYAGDEQGMRGVKEERAGGDDAVRPEFPQQPGELVPGGWQVHALHRELLALRRRHPWLWDARPEILTTTNTELVYRVAGPSGESLVVALNIDEQPARLDVPAATAVAAGAGRLDGAAVELDGFGWAVLTAG
ncbi:alpha-amylase family protein [Georgenia sp. MJ173]|uniref:alpha-amylase family protein n=1 Tax=Georgenia sunbinii TaxID=3117728 RepID=UPI002F262ED8